MTPSLRTSTCLASTIVESLCVTTSADRPTTRSNSAACTSFSFDESSAEVASSSSSTRGLRSTARAIASRCRCPPERLQPRSPTVAM
mmetsp:Transcript_11090/g.18563  ORF Transcript_11090/g.18563 Transcript_11090/m.18563 type:complete len:87 (-) Transcript_11090:343-603(-)